MLAGDARSEWRGSVLPDPRVVHLWDQNRLAGRWFAERVQRHGGIAWDAYFLYTAQAKWEGIPSPLLGSGSTVIARRSDLQRSLLPELAPR